MENIVIKGARLHNLQNINITIPKNKLIVATGISGSGKSSLMFDIIFEEGRKQYLQSLGILASFDDEDKFDSISGIGPTIAVQQSSIRQSNTRSTVGSRTNLLSMLALLYAAEGQLTCSTCGALVGDELTCPQCGSVEERLPAAYFSYNSPKGMCLKCSGRGAYDEINLEKLSPHRSDTLEQVLNRAGMTPGYLRLFKRKFAPHLSRPFWDLPEEVRDEVINGHYLSGRSEKRSSCLMRIFQARLGRGEDLNGLYGKAICPECYGFRIGEEARRVLLDGKHIGELGLMTLVELNAFLDGLQQQPLSPFGLNLLKDLLAKTGQFIHSRLGYLSLYRETPTLSGGEIQRLFLNIHLDSRLDSLIYVLDEPSVGLHESEKAVLLNSIKELKEIGNTVIVVEHDKSTIQMAEHIIDFGPKAGAEGGQVIYQGDLAGLLACKASLTGQYLSGEAAMPARRLHPNPAAAPCLTIHSARTNNLKDLTVSFPLGCMVGVAGVSGSGKSSLVSDTLLPLLKRCASHPGVDQEDDDVDGEDEPGSAMLIADRLEGLEHINGFAEISQAPIGKNSSSNPATYTGLWDKMRALFAAQPQALEQSLSAGHFSFNSKGACSLCGGSGLETIWLGGGMKLDKSCAKCRGKRFNEQALSVTYRGKNIHDILEMSISDAMHFFADKRDLAPALKVMERIGMGYLKLGQPTPTLSGGEAQRIKLAKEIGRQRKGNILYVLDEPTTGLSLYDTALLIKLLDELVANGSSVIVIEHNIEVLSACDWLIELGPGGGAQGGQLIAQGALQALKNNPQSITGRYLP